MKPAGWYRYVQRCPDCGGLSSVLAHVGDDGGEPFMVGEDHAAGAVPAVSVAPGAVRAFLAWWRGDRRLIPRGWSAVVRDGSIH